MEATHFESLYPAQSRFDEIEKILKFAREGKSSQLVGLPGVGRSNTLGLLSYNKNIRKKHLGENQKWFHFVSCDFSEIRKKPVSDAMKFIFLRLADSLRERKILKNAESEFAGEGSFEQIDKIFKESAATNDEMVLFQGLKRAIDFLCIEKELTIVFLFDRFEEYIPMLTPEFFANLRVLRNRAKYRFSVVFSLNRPLEELIEPILFADFYEFLADNIVYLPILDKPGLDFRISYLEKVTMKQLNNETIEQVLLLTGGHGKLTRLSLETILATSDWPLATSEKLQEFLLEQKSVKASLYEIWISLIPEEQLLLASREKRLAFSFSGSSYLEKIGLLKNEVITIPLFEEFISTLLRQDSGRAQQISFDQNTNEIKMGETALSDSLTSSEFKLLKFLLDNPDKLIEREEIIKAVWKDEKTTEGVTDQALDQLIFRLRKKIEVDPNNPVHLQTLKGKGIRFSNR
ncbi:MAG: helix-turn-helix domain-containing protein [Patescibacteria group bacterium]